MSHTAKLGLLSLALFIASVFVYRFEHQTNDSLLAGSDFISGLNVDKVFAIEIKKNKNEKITLQRDNDLFVLREFGDYPASTKKVNDLLFKIVRIKVDDLVTSSPQKHKEFKVSNDDFEREIILYDENMKPLTQFYVGKNAPREGHFLRFTDKPEVYRSKDFSYFDYSKFDYIEKDILSLKKQDISKIIVNSKMNFEIEAKGDLFLSKTLKKLSDKDLEKFVNNFETISVDDFLSKENVLDLPSSATSKVKIFLKDKTMYELSLAAQSGKYYMWVEASLYDVPTQITLSEDDSKDKLEGIESILSVQEASQKFNLRHGAWAYIIDEDVYNSLTHAPSKVE